MTELDYLGEIKRDIRLYIEDCISYKQPLNFNTLRDEVELHVTGNADGSYTFNSKVAYDNVIDLLNPIYPLDMVGDVVDYLCISMEELGEILYTKNWDKLDVLIRMYLFNEAWEEVVLEYDKAK